MQQRGERLADEAKTKQITRRQTENVKQSQVTTERAEDASAAESQMLARAREAIAPFLPKPAAKSA